MKMTLILALSLCVLTLAVFGDDEPAEFTEPMESTVRYGGGGGPMPSLLFLDLDDLNDAITDADYPQISQVLFATGGGGYGGDLDGIRIGGFGIAGDTLSVSASRSVSFDLAYGGMMIEKATHTEDNFTVVLGTMLGFGNLDLRFISSLPETFEDAVNNPFVSSMTKGFYAVQPYIAFESKPYSWMWARFQLGFLWTLAGDWSFEDAEFPGPPRALGGLTASLMIRFGSGGQILLEDVEAALEEMAGELEVLEDSDHDSEPDPQPTEAED